MITEYKLVDNKIIKNVFSEENTTIIGKNNKEYPVLRLYKIDDSDKEYIKSIKKSELDSPSRKTKFYIMGFSEENDIKAYEYFKSVFLKRAQKLKIATSFNNEQLSSFIEKNEYKAPMC